MVELNKRGKGHFRLPTEAEWEYAARGGNDPKADMLTAYSFGNDTTQLGDHAVYNDNSNNETKPIASKKANPIGLYDMHGNVWEWVEDAYGPYEANAKDPVNESSGSDRVIRGGSWAGYARNARSAFRFGRDPGGRNGDLGFRLVRAEP